MNNDAARGIPRPEHPKPQFYREDWINLNGQWSFDFDFSVSGMAKEWFKKEKFDMKITVPFCPESSLSGIGFTDFIPAVWYYRKFTVNKSQIRKITLLHFGAVDYFTRVWVNGTEAGTHKGGYSSFCFDITKLVRAGTNTLHVYAKDDVRSGSQPAGKQAQQYMSHDCSYTRTTGIWQTVWLEFVPQVYIKSVKMTPDAANNSIFIEAKLSGDSDGADLSAVAYNGDAVFGRGAVKAAGNMAYMCLKLDAIIWWDIKNPYLYDIKFTLQKGEHHDEVASYFGLRLIEWKNNAMYLNRKPLFQRLVLDQGFYPDGIYTAPSDAALERDIKLAMDIGFNGARLHQKIFEERFLYHADRLGYLVWGEHASWCLDINRPDALKNFLPEWLETLERDFNHPSIVGCCPFNESYDGSRKTETIGIHEKA
ncbi:MAG: beta-galactosidase, partial [Defluviitaleaceae bacterium]|nr:beta-galactosidase [Defluviitaleaceae bacterium]